MLKVSELNKEWYKLSEVAELIGRGPDTVFRYAEQGKFTLNQLKPRGWYYISQNEVINYLKENGMVYDDLTDSKVTALYARVSSQKQKESGDLDRQISDLVISSQGEKTKVYTDIGSGLNDNRRGLIKLFKDITDNKVSKVVVTNQDRLTRFGFGYLEFFFSNYGVDIGILSEGDSDSAQQELVDDMMGLIASFSGRFYGLRSAQKRKAREVIEELDDD